MLEMKQRPRIYFSEADKALMWDRRQQGDSLHAIAGLFDRGHSSVQGVIAQTGGIRQREETFEIGADVIGTRRDLRAVLWPATQCDRWRSHWDAHRQR